ncbi:MAG: transcriptional regulator [Halobacteriovoraceae bacterium]|nr:transcriptional regulator [Halobacteriovoraceae bacterium]|tara:strand:- start:6844 stop:7179 length:336 start_codon:yes stop_codon:yes gene_type:complete
MKLITAIIRDNKLEDVREALIQAEITRITVNRVAGHGAAEDIEIYRGRQIAPALTSKVELKIACNDEFVDIVKNTIIETARTGEQGDGKIFVQNLEECIRIKNGESGSGAI